MFTSFSYMQKYILTFGCLLSSRSLPLLPIRSLSLHLLDETYTYLIVLSSSVDLQTLFIYTLSHCQNTRLARDSLLL